MIPLRLTCLLLFLLPSLTLAEESGKTLTWVGCGITKKAFMKDLAAAWEKKSGIHIDIQGGGATRGIREVAAGKADIGGSCRYKIEGNPKELKARMQPVAWDALVVITHRDNPVSDISLKQLRAIYLGEITNWKELGGEDHPIEVYARRSKISGVGHALRKLVFANFEQEFRASEFFKSSGPLEKRLESDAGRYGIGVTGISSARKRNVKILSLEGIHPTPEDIRSGKYMLYRPLYLVYNLQRQMEHPEIREFIRFAQSKEGREIIRRNQVVPYSDALGLIMKQLEQERRARDMGLYEHAAN